MRQRRARGEDAARPGDQPLVVVEKVAGALRLAAILPEAAARGLKPGMPLAEARAFVPALDIADADPQADTALLTAIADWCDRFTPLVAFDGADGLLLDMTGCSHLFGGEEAFLRDIRQRLGRSRLHVAAAIAGTAEAAAALARIAPETIVAPGEEAASLSPLPLAALALDAATLKGLHRAGLTAIGEVAGRGRAELAARFGAGLVDRLDRALGRATAPISPRRPLPTYIVERRFAEPVATDDVVQATLLRLASTLSTMLEVRDEGLRRVEASFFRADGQVRRIAVETARSIRAPEAVARLFRERLAALADPLDPGFGFDLIRLSAEVAEPLALKAPALGDEAQDEAGEIDGLVDRLSARLGPRRVLRVRPVDTHVPEASFVFQPAQRQSLSGHDPASPWIRLGETDEPPVRPIRLFLRPEPVEVVAEVPDGPPLRFRWRRALHAVAHAEGPERIVMEWWRQGGALPTRDYYRVEDQEGRRFWLYRDGLYGAPSLRPAWFVHGLFA